MNHTGIRRKSHAEQTLMTEGPIYSQIVWFALPLFLGNLFQQLYNAVDSLIVGNYVGSSALAAVSSSGNLIFLAVGFFNGLSIGGSVLIARYLGAREEDNVECAVHTSAALGLIFSVIMTVLGVAFAPAVLRLMQTPADVLPESMTYFRIYFAGSLGFIMYNILVGILQGAGDSRHPLYYLIISSLVNVILDLLLVTQFHMGVGGAALATVISQLLSMVLALRRLHHIGGALHLSFRKIRLDRKMAGAILRLGLPSGVQNSIIAFSNVLIQSYINSFGSAAVAGIGSYQKLEGFAFLPVTSFAMALPAFISQNLGAKEPERARKGAWFGIACATAVAALIGLFFTFFGPNLIALFDRSPEVIAFGSGRARIVGPFFALVAYTHMMAATLRGAQRPMVPMVIMLVCWCAVRILVLAVSSLFIHDIAVTYWVYPITWTLSSITFTVYYRRERIFDEGSKAGI